ncbi:glycine cleavage system protein H [Granulicatella sp. zg-ZJ]|uniref:glycine cleavage system protein H n=1 Tax=Granulicatella sp. zg-ZJ TaxID=2678504 RepID=UPI0013D62992|nr:glycine cleavage system protein H [Granulicatella sp. zg-ZJ]NEW62738.1 glycine cleavage system protein H [Granulicatella sp. zg-ZJ]
MKYSENGFWVEKIDTYYWFGLSEKGQDDLGDIAFLEFLSEDTISTEESFMGVEASKAVTELTGPLNAHVLKWHEALEKHPELLNSQSKDDNWIAYIDQVDDKAYQSLKDTSGLS